MRGPRDIRIWAGAALLLLAICLPLRARQAPPAELEVHFFDQAGIDHGTHRAIEGELRVILEHAGIGLRWVDDAERLDPAPAVRHPAIRVILIRTRHIDPRLREQMKNTDSPLGLCYQSGESQELASTVYLLHENLLAAACKRCNGAPVASIYFTAAAGRAAAHEIFHVLLNDRGHSKTGIMRARIDWKQLTSPVSGSLLLSPGDALRLRQSFQTAD